MTFFIALLFISLLINLLMPRRFYFVRHGETVLNAKRVKQGEEGELSEQGRTQAERVGLYLRQFSIEHILSSTYPRAKETSGIIKAHLHVPISYSPLLAERRNPHEVIGRPVSDPEVVHIVDQIDQAYHEDEYRYSDEENFVDLKVRARKCLSLLAHQGAHRTCVVTHHAFLKILIAYMLHGEELHAGDFVKLSFFNVSDNAGITVCEFRPLHLLSKTRGWKVLSYNERLY